MEGSVTAVGRSWVINKYMSTRQEFVHKVACICLKQNPCTSYHSRYGTPEADQDVQ